MIKYKVANKYATALFELTKELKSEEKVLKDLATVNDIFQNSKEFKIVMIGAVISTDEKKSIIDTFAKKFKFNEVTNNFLKVLIDKRKFKFLPHIFDKYQKLYKESTGVISVNVVSAIKLDKSITDKLTKKLSEVFNKKLEFKNIVNPDILGGIIVKTEEMTYDASLKLQLNRLKENILKG